MKREIEKLIDRLASKELSKGCFVEMDLFGVKEVIATSKCHDTPLCITYWERNENDWFGIQHQDIKGIKKILGHPILIGRCLKQVRERSAAKWDADQSKLISLWLNCDETLEASLQSIFGEAEWEEVDVLHAKYASGHEEVFHELRPKQKCIEELFSFLISLKLES